MIDSFNKSAFLFFNQLADQSAWLNWIIIAAAEYLPFLFIAYLVCLWLSKDKDYRENSLLAGYSAIIGIGMNFFIGLFYFHPRPYVENIGVAIINHVPDASFPSDHTTFMLSIAFTLFFLKKKKTAGFVLIALGVVGGLSRVASGIHYPLDIVGSIVVSIAASTVILLLKEKLNPVNQYIDYLYDRLLNKIV